jgi:hypothetical protein
MLSFVAKSCLGIASLSAMLSFFSVVTPSASALSINGNNVENITSGDIGQSFAISFGGNISGKDRAGLSSEAILKLSGFETVTKVINGINKQVTEVKFDILLGNTSDKTIVSSRTSGFGFDVSQTLLGATITGIDSKTSPLFTKANLDSKLFEGKNDNVDLCFSDNTNNCRGGASGGVTTGNKGSFSTSFYLDSSVKKINLNNFGVRYQSIDLTSTTKFDGQSGTGYPLKVAPKGSKNWEDCKDSQLW